VLIVLEHAKGRCAYCNSLAVGTGTRGIGTPTLTAHFLAMEARATAASGDATTTLRLLSEAARTFDRSQRDSDPEWIAYFDDAELSAEFGHCFRDIGRGTAPFLMSTVHSMPPRVCQSVATSS
jgi:hypothetical protein